MSQINADDADNIASDVGTMVSTFKSTRLSQSDHELDFTFRDLIKHQEDMVHRLELQRTGRDSAWKKKLKGNMNQPGGCCVVC